MKSSTSEVNIKWRRNENICKSCDGTGVQINQKTGLKQRCPDCKGSGVWTDPAEYGKITWIV